MWSCMVPKWSCMMAFWSCTFAFWSCMTALGSCTFALLTCIGSGDLHFSRDLHFGGFPALHEVIRRSYSHLGLQTGQVTESGDSEARNYGISEFFIILGIFQKPKLGSNSLNYGKSVQKTQKCEYLGNQ